MTKKIYLLLVAIIFCLSMTDPLTGLAAAPVLHTSLDAANPIQFFGSYIIYNGQTISLSPNALYVDGSMPDSTANAYPYVFNNFDTDVVGQNFNGVTGADFGSKAIVPYLNSDPVKALGTEAAPVVVYMAPYVYWGDDWTDPTIRKPTDPGGLYGTTITCKWLKLVGLTDNRDKVVICGDRGQTNGSNGNWTLFNIAGDGLRTEHLTIANYCNVDLDYPLKPALSHAKRTSTTCQAQLVSYSGDKAVAIDTSFKSRLNLMPFSGTRTLYYKCHFECTDDSISGSAVYLECDFDFYGDCPAGGFGGAVFLNSTFTSHISDTEQGLSKYPGPGAIIDGRFIRDLELGPIKVVWSPYADSQLPTLRSYQSNVTLNGQPITISPDSPGMTVDITNSPDALAAYKFTYEGVTYYNTYNLLRGNDSWDPMGIKEIVASVSALAGTGKDFGNIPIRMAVNLQSGSSAVISSGSATSLTASFTRNLPAQAGMVTWSVNSVDAAYAVLPVNPTGSSITITGNNSDELPRVVTVTARSAIGLVGAYRITINPTLIDPPVFTADPAITGPTDGKLSTSYALNLGARTDMSLITWYRCTDAQGSNAIPVAVSRMDSPEKTYTLTHGDIGYFLKITVEPKHIRSNPGSAKSAVSTAAITSADVKTHYIETNFQNFPVTPQTQLLPGFWTVNAYKPPDTYDAATYPTRSFSNWTPTTGTSMNYATGQDGAAGYGLIGTSQGGRILYTPHETSYKGDMKVVLLCDPEKNGGQGFGSANSQYVDLFINYDTAALNGYSVRVERTKAQSNGTEISLMKHTNGYSSYLPLDVYGSVETDGKITIRTSGYMAPCTLTVWTQGDKLYATIRSGKAESSEQVAVPLIHDVDLRATVTQNVYGGAGYINTGTTSAGNRTMLHNLRIDWLTSTVTFDSQGGTAVAPIMVNSGSTISLPSAPTKTGYTFEGWCKDAALTAPYDFSNLITADITLYAKWKVSTGLTANITSTNGNVTGLLPGYTFGDKVTVTAAAYPNYKFVSWADSAGKVLSTNNVYSFVITQNTDITANFAANTLFTVTFYNEANQIISAQTVEQGGNAIAPPNPTKPNFTFVKWDKAYTNVQGDLKIYPVFTANPLTFTLKVNNGTGSGTYNASTSVTVTGSVYGKQFSSWKDETGSIVSYNQTYSFIITRNMELTAVFVDTATPAVPNAALDNNVTYDTSDPTYVQMYFLGTFTVPKGYQRIECGFVSVKNAATNPGTSLTLQTSGATIMKATSLNQAGQVYRIIKTTYGSKFYVRGYMIYKNTATGEIVTIYSPNTVLGVKNK